MTRRAVAWGAAAAAALIAFYVTVLGTSAGWAHLRDQAQQDWWLLGPIIVAFGVQVALMVALRQRHRSGHLTATTGAGSGASAVGMVACCAHHLADLAPVLGAAGIAGTLFDWRIPVMAAGLLVNLAVIALAGRRLADTRCAA